MLLFLQKSKRAHRKANGQWICVACSASDGHSGEVLPACNPTQQAVVAQFHPAPFHGIRWLNNLPNIPLLTPGTEGKATGCGQRGFSNHSNRGVQGDAERDFLAAPFDSPVYACL